MTSVSMTHMPRRFCAVKHERMCTQGKKICMIQGQLDGR
jgi:hypothetical protein